jgi:hypothetical protein
MNKTLSKVVLTIVFSLTAVSANAEYTFTVLDGFAGSNYGSAISINNSGQIVGFSQAADGNYRATLSVNPYGLLPTNINRR